MTKQRIKEFLMACAIFAWGAFMIFLAYVFAGN